MTMTFGGICGTLMIFKASLFVPIIVGNVEVLETWLIIVIMYNIAYLHKVVNNRLSYRRNKKRKQFRKSNHSCGKMGKVENDRI